MINIEEIIREYIDKTVHLSLATVMNNKPWVREVHFTYDENLNLYFRSLSSRRHSLEIAKNPYVSGNIVQQFGLSEGCGGAISFEGTATLLTTDEQRKAVFPRFAATLGSEEKILAEAQTQEGHQFYKITVETWYAYGKFGEESSAKYSLDWNGGK